jgi:hypothetical protein
VLCFVDDEEHVLPCLPVDLSIRIPSSRILDSIQLLLLMRRYLKGGALVAASNRLSYLEK